MTTNMPPSSKTSSKKALLKPDMSKIVVLNFRVPAEVKKNFKIAAANYGITQTDLFQQMFEEWQQKHS